MTETLQESRDRIAYERRMRRKLEGSYAHDHTRCTSCTQLMGKFENICPACGQLAHPRRKL